MAAFPKIPKSIPCDLIHQFLGKLETAPDQYTVYIAVLGQPGVINAHPATLVKLDSDAWVMGCMGSIPQVVLK